MRTPPRGGHQSVPSNAEGRLGADTWEPAKDGACEPFGAAAFTGTGREVGYGV